MDSTGPSPAPPDAGADYIGQSQHFSASEKETDTALCCCEYINKDNQRYHILGCCCNCEDFDLVFDRLIFCKRVDPRHRKGMLLTFQDRLRIPWRDGAKQVSLDTLVPIVVVPLVFGIAAINAYTAAIMFLASSAFLAYAYYFLKQTVPRTKFFFMWILCSVVCMIVLFEFAVPLLELLPEENYILVIFVVVSLYCLWTTKKYATLNHVVQSPVDDDELVDITEEDEQQTALWLEHGEEAEDGKNQSTTCQNCRRHPRTFHCTVCQACIRRRDHHSFWLDCCIGEYNHRYYMMGLLFAELALLLGTNLILTAVCHPFLIVRLCGIPIMLPDDCSDVFDEYDLSISFVMAVYGLAMAVYVLLAMFRQCYLISRGTTWSECRRGQSANRKTIVQNWKSFIC